MSASEQPEKETKRRPGEDEGRRAGGRQADGVHHVPLFLRGMSDGHKGDAQDEKDEVGE